MAIFVQCVCGQRFQAEDRLAGTRCSCTNCGRLLDIPVGSATRSGIVCSCICGRRFQAPAHMAGQQTNCPVCHALLTIPNYSGSAAEVAPAPLSSWEAAISVPSKVTQRPSRKPARFLQSKYTRLYVIAGVVAAVLCILIIGTVVVIKGVRGPFQAVVGGELDAKTEDYAAAVDDSHDQLARRNSRPEVPGGFDLQSLPTQEEMEAKNAEREAREEAKTRNFLREQEERFRQMEENAKAAYRATGLGAEPAVALFGEQPLGGGYAITPPDGYYCTRDSGVLRKNVIDFEFTGAGEPRSTLSVTIETNEIFATMSRPPMIHQEPPSNFRAPVVFANGAFYLPRDGLSQRTIDGVEFWVKEIEFNHAKGVTRGVFLLGLNGKDLIQIRAFSLVPAESDELSALRRAALSIRKDASFSKADIPTAGTLPGK